MLDIILVHDYPEGQPEYCFDSIFQLLKVNTKRIIVLTQKSNFEISQKKIQNFVISCQSEIVFVALEALEINDSIEEFKMEPFWIRTIRRFFFICSYMKQEKSRSVFHLENDCLLLTNIETLYNYFIVPEKLENKLVVPQDSPTRAVASMMYIPQFEVLQGFLDYTLETLKSGFKNDMELLGAYQDKESFPVKPSKYGIVDPCCFGQCLAGINVHKNEMVNPTIGFINETSTFKPNLELFNQINGEWYYGLSKLHLLHIHSKDLYKFQCIKPADVIQGEIFENNIPDWKRYTGEEPIIYIKTDELPLFKEKLLYNLKQNTTIVCHNSDQSFTDLEVLNNEKVISVRAVNPNIIHPKLQFLPLGMANSCWPHGNKEILFQVIGETYKYRKTKGLHIAMKTSTFSYREQIVLPFENKVIEDYREYLVDLAQHRYSLCVRGNAQDTHRFWESLYLGVIPVIINNKYTNSTAFVQHLRNAKVKFLEICDESLEVIHEKLKQLQN